MNTKLKEQQKRSDTSMSFYSQQFQTAYVLKSINDLIKTYPILEQSQIQAWFKYAAVFECVSNFEVKTSLGKNSRTRIIACVAQNILQRGIPTFAPQRLEKILSKDLDGGITAKDVIKSLIFIDESYNFNTKKRFFQKSYDGSLVPAEVNNTEVNFLKKISEDDKLKYLAQFMEPQKPFEHIVLYPNTDIEKYTNYARYCLDESMSEILQTVRDQRVDFSIELPKLSNTTPNCCAIELDGPSHLDNAQRVKDALRDDILKELNWANTVRITDTLEEDQYHCVMNGLIAPIREIVNDDKAKVIPAIREALLSSRIAFVILKMVECGIINIRGNDVNIYLEKGTNTQIAMQGISIAYDMLYHLFSLVEGEDYKLNKWMIYTAEQDVYEIIEDQNPIHKGEQSITHNNVTLIIEDCSLYRLFDFNPSSSHASKKVWIYSAYGIDSTRTFNMAKSISYKINSSSEAHLEYFLRDVFQKEHFRPKQVDIIGAALSRKNVVGLLPTGSGKSLTYQMSTLLQPGIGMVVAPLISLMADQVKNLHNILIDSSITINSTVSGAEKRRLMNRLKNNEFLFVYVSPERLQIREFKDVLSTLTIHTLIVDEAHCVSQWGHDFRTAYLRIGETMKKYVKTHITMALTGTASCNVVTDIKRELSMSNKVEIVTPNDFRRPELHFEIIELPADKPLKERLSKELILNTINRAVESVSKQADFKNIETGDFYDFFRTENGKYINTGLIFCPFAKKNEESVASIGELFAEGDAQSDNNNDKKIKIGTYHGQLLDKLKQESQRKFTDNETCLLIATKAFGMGIDKPNIRFTVHLTVPESVESFYQEAGRAGRDRQAAVNVILAPPLDNEYKDISDKKIYDFFTEMSFPSKGKFVESLADLMETGLLTPKTMKASLLEGIRELDVPQSEVNLDIDADKNVMLTIQCGKDNSIYRTDVDDNGDVKFSYIEGEYGKRSHFKKNYMRGCFENNITKQIEEKIKENPKITKRSFSKSFNLEKYDNTDSIKDILNNLKKGEEQDCYIGVGKGFLLNWVDEILRYLIAQKKSNKKAPLTLTQELVRKIRDASKKAAKAKSNYKIGDFYDTFNKIRKDNGMPELSPKEYANLANGMKPDWENTLDNMQDKFVYYMGVLKIYSDFERSYSPSYIKIRLKSVDKEELKKNIKEFIGNYETTDYVKRKVNLSWMDDLEDQPAELVFESLRYIIDYSYDKIRTFRVKQSETMYQCMQANDKKNANAFIDEVYKYFESKYSDELLHDVENENLKLPMQWIKRIRKASEEDRENLLEDLSHLRTSALKVEEARPQAFTPYFLYAYATFMDHNLDIRHGIRAYLKGVSLLTGLRQNYRKLLKDFCDEIFSTDDVQYLKEVKKVLHNEVSIIKAQLKEAKKKDADQNDVDDFNQEWLNEFINVLDDNIAQKNGISLF